MKVANRSKDRNKAEFARKVMERFSKPGNLFNLAIPSNWSQRDVIDVLEANQVKVFVKNANTIHTWTAYNCSPEEMESIPEVW